MFGIVLLIIAACAPMAFGGGLVGRPAFCIGTDAVAMTVEFSGMRYSIENDAYVGGAQDDEVETQRGLLRASFGLAPGVDADVAAGTADLSFRSGPPGYSTFRSGWSFAWGGGVRLGYPHGREPWQLQLSASYLGFIADGETSNAQKTLNSRYTWQELTPTLTAGYRFGRLTPYVGLMQTVLFGTRETSVKFLGIERPDTGGKRSYTDVKQKPHGLLGVDWLLPDGYYVTAGLSASGRGEWGFAVGVAQALK
jgi:hypothetical protein